MSAGIAERNVWWGDLGKKINRVYSMTSSPSITPRLLFHERVNHVSFAEANTHLIDTPYWGGADQIVNENVSRTTLRTYFFNAGWYGGCAGELAQLLDNVPSNSNRTHTTAFVYEQIAWCTNVAWCVHSMLLATNIYPMWWSTGLRFARNIEYMPPEFGYEGSMTWISAAPTQTLDTDAVTSLVTQPFSFLNATLDVGMDRSSLIQWYNFQKNQPWAGRVLVADKSDAPKKFDKDNVQGLALLIARAGMFGGLDKVANSMLSFKDTSAGPAAVVAYWKRMAQFMVKRPYWRVVSGGVAAWKWYNIASLSIKKLGLCREDMIEVYEAHKDAKKVWKIAAITGLVIDTVKVMYKAISGDLYDFAKDYYSYARKYNVFGQEAKDKVENPNVPPYEGAFVMPPMFIRSPFNTKYSYDMMRSKNTATSCEASGACEQLIGTTAALLKLEKSVRATELVLGDGTQIWDPPAPELTQVAISNKVPPKASPPGIAPKKNYAPLVTAGVLTGFAGYLLWRSQR